jgi:hypothetical protein
MENRPIGHKIYQQLPLQESLKFTQCRIFGLKKYHLATLLPTTFESLVWIDIDG